MVSRLRALLVRWNYWNYLTMYLYIIYKNVPKRFPTVTLCEVLRPVIGNREAILESTDWFKVVVLDSICVNCDARTVHWLSQTTPEANYIHRHRDSKLNPKLVSKFFSTHEPLIEDMESLNLNPSINELFDIATEIVSDVDNKKQFDVVNNTDKLFNLLRVFLLPEIKFHERDINAIKAGQKWIEWQKDANIQHLKVSSSSKRSCEDLLRKQRELLINSFAGSKSCHYIATCDKTFLGYFLEHLENDVKSTNNELIKLEAAMKPLRDSQSVRNIDLLSGYRSIRDAVYNVNVKCMTAREEIKNVIDRPHPVEPMRRRSTEHHQFHIAYVKATRQLLKTESEIQGLNNITARISSVIDAVLHTIQELEGNEQPRPLRHPHNDSAEQSTLLGKVSSIICDDKFDFGAKDNTFINVIIDKVQSIIDQTNGSNDSGLEAIVESLSARTRYTSRSLRFSGSFPDAKDICKEVTKHISEQSMRIADILLLKLEMDSANEIYICYENHLSKLLMPILVELYRQRYRDHCTDLFKWVSNSTLLNIGVDISTFAALVGINEDQSEMLDETCTINLSDLCKSSDYGSENMNFAEILTILDGLNFNQRHTISERCSSECIRVPTVVKHSTALNDNATNENKTDMSSAAIESDVTELSIKRKSLIQHELNKLRDEAEQFVKTIYDAASLFEKLDKVKLFLRFIERQLQGIQNNDQNDTAVSADELLDAVIIIITQLEAETILTLFSSITLMQHISPCFVSDGEYDYALHTFCGAYHYLFGLCRRENEGPTSQTNDQ